MFVVLRNIGYVHGKVLRYIPLYSTCCAARMRTLCNYTPEGADVLQCVYRASFQGNDNTHLVLLTQKQTYYNHATKPSAGIWCRSGSTIYGTGFTQRRCTCAVFLQQPEHCTQVTQTCAEYVRNNRGINYTVPHGRLLHPPYAFL